MNTLAKQYEINFDKIYPLQRKQEIINSFTIIQGAYKSGKSYIIYDYLRQYDQAQYLYIDMNDIRIDQDTIFYNLDRFLLQNPKIVVLAIDNYPDTSINFLANLKQLKSIIISSVYLIKSDKYKYINLKPLDFEEYILFDNKHQTTVNKFNSFLKYGNLPEIIQYNDDKKLKQNQNILKLICSNQLEFNILKLYIKSSGEKKSVFQLFNEMKKTQKISKNLFYTTTKILQEQQLIYMCEKFNQQKAPKKIFCYNFALINSVTFNKNFNNTFANMIFLELINRYKDIYYLDYVDFYIKDNNSIILALPFFIDHITLSTKLMPIIEKYQIENITIVTVGINNTIFINDIECEVLPFYEWALGL